VQKGGSSAATSCQPEIVGQLAGIELERPLHTRRHNLVTVGGRVWLEQTRSKRSVLKFTVPAVVAGAHLGSRSRPSPVVPLAPLRAWSR